MKILIVTFLLFFSTSLLAKTPQSAESMIHNFKDVSFCTERIWPAYTWRGYSILGVNLENALQIALDIDHTLSIYPISLDDLEGGEGARSTYAFFESNGKNWVSVNQAYSDDSKGEFGLFELGAHEIFHHVGQKNWKNKSSGGRGTQIPIHWEPRYYRAMLQKNLREAFIEPENRVVSMGKAKYWFTKWKNEFPLEVNSTTDGYEGTASYAEAISVALAKDGCDAAEGQLRSYATSVVKKDMSLINSIRRATDLSIEGYSIGSLASFLLRWDAPVEQWEKRVEVGESPVEILLQDTEVVIEEADNKLSEEFEAMAAEISRLATTEIGEAQKIMTSDSLVMLMLPRSWKPGSTGYNGFYVDTETSINYGVISDELNFVSGENRLKSEIGLVTVRFNTTHPCEEYGWTIPVRVSDVVAMGSKFIVSGDKIAGTTAGKMKLSSDGVKWLCAGEMN